VYEDVVSIFIFFFYTGNTPTFSTNERSQKGLIVINKYLQPIDFEANASASSPDISSFFFFYRVPFAFCIHFSSWNLGHNARHKVKTWW
jgi:hypothetical protein|tara:strand:+ start:290 stop:556 length:267 start_codon:yes stop_codon:yes gene_type:complete